MKKELVFLQIGEYRSPENFLRKVGDLIQIPITEKTKVEQVFNELFKHVEVNEDNLAAIVAYTHTYSHSDERRAFMNYHMFVPEPGLDLYGIFELKELKT